MVSIKLTKCPVSRSPDTTATSAKVADLSGKPERNCIERSDLLAVFRNTKGPRSHHGTTCSSQIPFDVFPGYEEAGRCVKSSEAIC